MRIGVVADTHLPKKGQHLPDQLVAGLRGCSLILHAGDWTSLAVYELLQALAPVQGVYGNVDEPAVKERFPALLRFSLEGYQIGVVHGHEGKGRSTPERALGAFQDQPVDLVIFGHSHIPLLEEREGVLLFNPGSPTDKRREATFSYGIIELTASGIKAWHERFLP